MSLHLGIFFYLVDDIVDEADDAWITMSKAHTWGTMSSAGISLLGWACVDTFSGQFVLAGAATNLWRLDCR